MSGDEKARLAVDVGGTFTDVVIERAGLQHSVKVLTTPAEPARGIMEGIRWVLDRAGVAAADVGAIIHGTTLATNALIERRGARTALVTTAGFRDIVEIGYENRFEQYDYNIEKAAPLVARPLRFTVTERISARGDVLVPLDEREARQVAGELSRQGVESVAIGFINAYVDPAHERAAARIIEEVCPGISVTLSSEVCPEPREYDRFSTACANAYVRPMMAGYLADLTARVREMGLRCPLLLMTSAGGLTTVETAMAFPVRLVESGPAGGAMLAVAVAEQCGLDRILAFDMGGTTAKLCLVNDGTPLTTRTFEVDRQYNFARGSGFPIRVPVIDLVEIGAGGGSIAATNVLGHVKVGPHSAGSSPGPACYGLGGERPTVTDADVVLGYINPSAFAGGSIPLDAGKAERAVMEGVGRPLQMDSEAAAGAIRRIVDEAMASAARIHAIERGVDVAGRSLIAFGGAAPLHAASVAQRLGISRVVVPRAAGVGSAVGFLRAPVSFEVVRSIYMKLSSFDAELVRRSLAEMRAQATEIVRQLVRDEALHETVRVDMRYSGQGHDIVVPVAAQVDADALRRAFERIYLDGYGSTLPGMDIECVTWSLSVSAARPGVEAQPGRRPGLPASGGAAAANGNREVRRLRREEISAQDVVAGPALIVEDQTTTLLPDGAEAWLHPAGHLIIEMPTASARQAS